MPFVWKMIPELTVGEVYVDSRSPLFPLWCGLLFLIPWSDSFQILEDKRIRKEKKDINNTLIDLALDARQEYEEGNYSSFKEAYTHYANTYTSNGKSFTANQLENAYQSAKSKGRI